MVVWNMFIRMGLQLFYPFVCYSMINIYKSDSIVQQAVDIIKILVCLSFMAFTFVFMRRHAEDVDSKEFKQRYGGFMTNCETYKKPRAT